MQWNFGERIAVWGCYKLGLGYDISTVQAS